MGALTLTSRAIIGMFYSQLEAAQAESWLPRVATRIDSNQDEEVLAFLTQTPVMREWIAGRQSQTLDTKTIRTPNKHWEATVEFQSKEIRRDKTPQIQARIKELAVRAAQHPQKLLSELIVAGESSLCYDGQYFFDTDHAEGDSGSQSNSITVDITTLGVPLAQQGTTTDPSGWVLANAISRAIAHMMSIKDDRGEPYHVPFMKEAAGTMSFMVMLPNSYLSAEQQLYAREFAFGVPNPLYAMPKIQLEFVRNARLTWTDKLAVFRTDSLTKPLIHQVETEIMLKAKAEGSEFEFDTDLQQYGVDSWHNVNYGYWQNALLARLT